MSAFLRGFRDELVKTGGAGILKSVGKFVVKHPIIALSAGATGLGTAAAAHQAYKGGLEGGEKPRYLAAAADPATGQTQASEAAYANYHQLFPHKPTERQKWDLSRHYDERKFRS